MRAPDRPSTTVRRTLCAAWGVAATLAQCVAAGHGFSDPGAWPPRGLLALPDPPVPAGPWPNALIGCAALALAALAGWIVTARRLASRLARLQETEGRLRESEAALQQTQAIGRMGSWSADLVSGRFSGSPEAARLIGLSPPMASFSEILARVHPDDRARVDRAWKSALRSGTYEIEHRMQAGDRDCWVQVKARIEHDPDGRPARATGVTLDITDRREAEQSLRASEARLRQLTEFLPVLVWSARPDGGVDYTSQRWVEFTGCAAQALQAQGWLGVVHEEERPRVAETWRHAIRDEADFHAEYRIRRYDGESRWFEAQAAPLRDEGGAVTRWLGCCMDVHDARLLRDELQNLNAELEQRVEQRTIELEAANRELEAFSYSVSHDLRAPLRTIDGFSEALMEDFAGDLPDEARRFLHLIRQGAQRMGMLIDDVLAFSQLTRQPLRRQRVNMLRLVNDVLDELRPEIGARPLELEIAALPVVQADPALTRQVWLNLLSNALKYTRGRSPARVSVSFRPHNEELVFEVSDNGTGFDMNYASKLFRVFQRLHNDSEFEGTGIGLAIVQRVVHRHGGRVWARAAVDRGATFSFTLGPEAAPGGR